MYRFWIPGVSLPAKSFETFKYPGLSPRTFLPKFVVDKMIATAFGMSWPSSVFLFSFLWFWIALNYWEYFCEFRIYIFIYVTIRCLLFLNIFFFPFSIFFDDQEIWDLYSSCMLQLYILIYCQNTPPLPSIIPLSYRLLRYCPAC